MDQKKEKAAGSDQQEDPLKKAETVIASIEKSAAKLEALAKREETVDDPKEVKEPEEKSPALDALEKVASSIDTLVGQITDLTGRVTKIEEQPLPSKVGSTKVVQKGGSNDGNTSRVDEIQKRLNDLDEMKKYHLEKYQSEKRWEEAFDLIAERDQLQGTV